VPGREDRTARGRMFGRPCSPSREGVSDSMIAEGGHTRLTPPRAVHTGPGQPLSPRLRNRPGASTARTHRHPTDAHRSTNMQFLQLHAGMFLRHHMLPGREKTPVPETAVSAPVRRSPRNCCLEIWQRQSNARRTATDRVPPAGGTEHRTQLLNRENVRFSSSNTG
jgi:hypothetical protein